MYTMYLANPVTTATVKPLSLYERQLAICESCFWCATVFQKLDASSNDSDGLESIRRYVHYVKTKLFH
jgi:hypothetical protein